MDNRPILNTAVIKEISSHDYDSNFIESPVSVASHDFICFSDTYDMNNSIFS